VAPTGRREAMGEDAVAVYLNTPTCAVAFVARWLTPGDPSGFYQLREDEPARRVPMKAHPLDYDRCCLSWHPPLKRQARPKKRPCSQLGR